MRVVAARARAVTLRFRRPVRTSVGDFPARESVLLELRDADGVAGYGEAAPWPGFTAESAREAHAVLARSLPLIEEATLEPPEWPAPLAAQVPAASTACAAIEGALWDLAARRATRPLAGFLNERVGSGCGAALERVPVSVLLVEREPAALRAEARRALAAGHRAAKLKLGAAELADDVARARAAREGLGPQVALRGDANGAWSERAALLALEALAPFDFAWVEQPVAAAAIEALARLRRVSPVRIAADESVASAPDAARVIESGAADVVVLKPAMLGGPARALALAARARRAGCDVVFTHAFESAIGARHALHCAAAWGDAGSVHGLVTEGLFERDVADPVACRAGEAVVPGEPGLGVRP